MQPTYFPWRGLLDLMDNVDLYVFLDDVQFAYRSWQHRNRVQRRDGDFVWLTVPTLRREGQKTKLNNVRIDQSQSWADRHIRILRQEFPESEERTALLSMMSGWKSKDCASRLLDVTIESTEFLRRALMIQTPTILSSSFEVIGAGADRLAAICAEVGADEYVAPPGSRTYLQSLTHLPGTQVPISYYNYDAREAHSANRAPASSCLQEVLLADKTSQR